MFCFCFSYSVFLLSDFVEKMSLFNYFICKEIPNEESLTAACTSLKENPPEYITLKKSKVFRWVYKLINSKIKNAMCLEKKKCKKLLNSHWNLAMQPQLRNWRKCSRPLLKVLSDIGSRDTRKNWKKRGKQTSKLL